MLDTNFGGSNIAPAEHNYSVYIHTSPSGKKYVGITSKIPIMRWKNGYGYVKNKCFYSAIIKYGWDNFKHEIVASGLTHELALRMEESLVAQYDSFKHGYNMTPGGDGLPGHPISPKAAKHGAKARSHPVCQYTINGDYIASYRSITSAMNITNVDSSSISSCARGECAYAGGYLWAYKGESPIIPDSIPDCYLYGSEKFTGYSIPLDPDFRSRCLKNRWKVNSLPISQYDLDLNKIADWDSTIEAERATGCLSSGISECIHGERHTCGGFYWAYKNQPVKIKEGLSPLRRVYQIDMETKEIIHTYKNLKEAELSTGISSAFISSVCTQHHKSGGGYYWMYEDSQYEINSNRENNRGRKVRCVETGEVFDNIKMASKKLNAIPSCISNCCAGKSKSSYGLHFEFVSCGD